MKKYKLIKEWPGSHGVGFIVFSDDESEYYSKYPEFWQEMPEYEVLKFQDKINKHIYNVLPDGHLLWDIPEYKGIKGNLHALNIKEVLEETDYLIYSTKRLSDGEIFTIGDLVNYTQKITLW